MKQLFRVKIRLYNSEKVRVKETPTGQFQGWMTVDSPLLDTGEPDLDYWLTKKEIGASKRDMIMEFNSPYVWSEDETKITYYIERGGQITHGEEGIPFRDETIKSEPKYGTKAIPRDLLGKIKLWELVIGLSTVAPVPLERPEGATKNRLMILKDDAINWDSGEMHITVYIPTEQDLERWRIEN